MEEVFLRTGLSVFWRRKEKQWHFRHLTNLYEKITMAKITMDRLVILRGIHMSKVLIVVDMQNDFIDGALGTPEAQAIVPKVIQKIRRHEGPVIYTRDTHDKDYPETQEGHKLNVPHCIEGSQGWELQENVVRLATQKQPRFFDKRTFGSMDLVNFLTMKNAEEKIDEIELIGPCTDTCIITNALTLKTFLPEALIKIDASCCAGTTPESYENALKAMDACQIIIEKPRMIIDEKDLMD